jgi:Potato inhibitor I family
LLLKLKIKTTMQTTFCCSASAFGSMMLLIIGLMAASTNLQYQGQQASNDIVQMPRISMATKQGPWPTCVGMTGDDCIAYIEENTQEFTIVLIPFGTMVTEDIQTDRVRVFVDSDGIVFQAPSRG